MIALAFLNVPPALAAGSRVALQLAVTNAGTETLSARATYPARLAYRWNGDEREPLRSVLWHPCAPGEQATYWVDVDVPPELGERVLTPAVVLEGARWLEDALATPVTIAIVAAETPVPDAIERYEERVHSQNGEDGIVRELVLRIGTAHRFAVEIGAGDGSENNSTLWLERYGWAGMLVEGDAASARTLRERYRARPDVTVVDRKIDAASLAGELQGAGVPAGFDVLSIDTDGNDYWYLQALAAWSPRIVVVEYNAFRGPNDDWVMPYDPGHVWNNDDYFGASLAAFERLGASLGYALIGVDRCGVNAFFVRDDLLAAAKFPRVTAHQAYRPLASAAARPLPVSSR